MKTAQLNLLFDRWQTNTTFVRDGVFCDNTYDAQRIKILYVLRDAHIVESAVPPYDLRTDLINHPQGEGKTWNNVARWTQALLDGKDFSEVDSISPKQLSEQMSRVAAINLKKSRGGAYADSAQISVHTQTNRENLTQQILICDPDIIIACGTYCDIREHLFTKCISETSLSLRAGERVVAAAEISGKKFSVVDYRHPGQECSKRKSYEDMLDIKHFLGL